jgi:hypothetical protein
MDLGLKKKSNSVIAFWVNKRGVKKVVFTEFRSQQANSLIENVIKGEEIHLAGDSTGIAK